MACAAKSVSQKSCDDYVPPLPFESLLMFNEVDENAEYGCLNLQYYISKSLEEVQQCVLSNDLNSYCAMLEASLKVKSCSIEATVEERVERSAGNEEDSPAALEDDEESDDETATDSDSSTEPTPEVTTAGAADLAKAISLTCLSVILLVLFY